MGHPEACEEENSSPGHSGGSWTWQAADGTLRDTLRQCWNRCVAPPGNDEMGRSFWSGRRPHQCGQVLALGGAHPLSHSPHLPIV